MLGGRRAYGDTSVCVNANSFSLSRLRDASISAGQWTDASGAVVTDFDPAAQGVGSYSFTFTPSGSCFTAATASVVVGAASQAVLRQRTLCSSAGDLDLSELIVSGPTAGRWTGNGVVGSSNTFSASAVGPGTYTLTFTPSGACGSPSTTDVSVEEATAIALNDATVCAGASRLAVSEVLPQNSPRGAWTGLTVVQDSFDVTGLAPGDYMVTFLADAMLAPCALPGIATIRVTPARQIALDNQQVCLSTAAFALSALEPATDGGGTWRLNGSLVTQFDPAAAGEGTYVLTYTAPGTCTAAANLTLEVTRAITVMLPADTLCATGSAVALTQYEPVGAPGGTFSLPDGTVVSQVDPALLGAGTFTYRYTPPSGSCLSNQPELQLTVTAPVQVSLSTDTICPTASPVDLRDFLLPMGTGGIWSGAGVSADGMFTPSNFSGTTQVSFQATDACTATATSTFDLVAVSTLSTRPH